MKVLSKTKLLVRVGVPIAAAALLATACSSGQQSAASPTSSAGKSAAVEVQVVRGPLGSYLADGSGRALYLFAADTGSTSTCDGACAGYWPPLIAEGSVQASGGAKAADLATINRSDGTKQVTYAGHPLYYYADDEKQGETDGQGLDDFGALWWLVAPSGEKITTSV